MTGERSGTGSEADSTKERLGPTKEPTQCDFCGKALGVNWFSLADKPYCSPCFHAQFWTPYQSVPDKAH